MSLIYYVGYYDPPENAEEKRKSFLAATNKMHYIVTAMEKMGHTVQIISPCCTEASKFIKGKVIPVGERSSVRMFDTHGSRSRVLRVLWRGLTVLEFCWYLLTHVKKGDTVIVYHSLALMRRIPWLKKLCGFRLAMEVEEIYGDVSQNFRQSRKELRYFRHADAYLFPAVQLHETINQTGKPYVLIHGTYQVEPDRECSFDDDRYHVVYAGTLDPRKGGAVMAAEAAPYLPENYFLHILGFGSEQEIAQMEALVQSVQEKSQCQIRYDGCLKGEDYIRFLQSCHVGLSTQNPDAAFNDTSFPSKILSYMANGLQVVTVRIPVVEDSAVGQDLHYYDTASSEQIAAAIVRACTQSAGSDGRGRLQQLDLQFCDALEKLWEAM